MERERGMETAGRLLRYELVGVGLDVGLLTCCLWRGVKEKGI